MTDPGWLVPDRIVEDALRAGLAAVDAALAAHTADTLLARIYRNYPDVERAEIKAWFAKHDLGKLVVQNYPHSEVHLPCIAIILEGEQQTQQYLGDQSGLVQLSTGESVIGSAERWKTTIGARVYAENAELLQWLYQFVKFTLSDRRDAIAAAGVAYNQSPMGRDLGFDQRFLPRFVYQRGLALTFEYDQLDATADDVSEITDARTGADARDAHDVQ